MTRRSSTTWRGLDLRLFLPVARWIVFCAFAAGCDSGPSLPVSTVQPAANADSLNESANVEPIKLLTAASALNAVEEVARLFEAETGVKVTVIGGASNSIARQILAGAPADLFLSANQTWADQVDQAGLAESRRPLLGNQLVLIVPRGNPASVRKPADLLGGATRRLALAAENAPAGMYADQALRSLDLQAQLEASGKVVRGQDVRIALSYVETGEAEAGIVFATDAKLSEKVVTVYTFDAATHDRIVYSSVLVRRDAPHPAARRLFDFLVTDAAQAVFKRHGFYTADVFSSPTGDSPGARRHVVGV